MGLNGKRRKLLRIFGDPKIAAIVIEHRDRFARDFARREQRCVANNAGDSPAVTGTIAPIHVLASANERMEEGSKGPFKRPYRIAPGAKRNPPVLYPAAREITFAEFVKWEQTQPRRHELITGRVVEVANGTFDHETITVNVIVGLDPYVDLPCRIFPATSIIQTISRTAENGFRPDVTVSCSEANVGDGLFVQEPRIVVEVLSPSNMGRDWNAKLFQYVNTPSIEQLVFIDSRTRYTESHIRDANGNWLPEIISEDNTHGEGNLYFPSLGASLLFTQIYRKTALVEAR